MAMTTRQSTKTITMPSATMASATEESVPERVTQRKPEGGRFRLQVDRQTKGSYATYEAAEKVGPVIKKEHPITVDAFRDRFGGECLTHAPDKPKPASRVIHASSPDICPGQISWDPKIGKQFRGHSAVNHAIEEYVRGRA